jgi:hypothetical protein
MVGFGPRPLRIPVMGIQKKILGRDKTDQISDITRISV